MEAAGEPAPWRLGITFATEGGICPSCRLDGVYFPFVPVFAPNGQVPLCAAA